MGLKAPTAPRATLELGKASGADPRPFAALTLCRSQRLAAMIRPPAQLSSSCRTQTRSPHPACVPVAMEAHRLAPSTTAIFHFGSTT